MLASQPASAGLPAGLGATLAWLPLTPLDIALRILVDRIAAAHPQLFERLGEHADKAFLIEPTDLPFLFVLQPRQGMPQIAVVRRPLMNGRADARIAGPLVVLLDLAEGRLDGDAMLFSRELTTSGDLEAILALRNALDDSELDLVAEAAALLGPFAGVGEWMGWLTRALLRRLSGAAAPSTSLQ